MSIPSCMVIPILYLASDEYFDLRMEMARQDGHQSVIRVPIPTENEETREGVWQDGAIITYQHDGEEIEDDLCWIGDPDNDLELSRQAAGEAKE